MPVSHAPKVVIVECAGRAVIKNYPTIRASFNNRMDSDSTKNPINLWKMIENRFTERRLNKVQGYLNEIGVFQNESNEDNKVFIDHFRKLVDEVRSIE